MKAELFAHQVSSKLLRHRIVQLGSEIDDDSATQICSQLLILENEDPQTDIRLYINSPGGSVTAGLAIYDTMQFLECDVATICYGIAASMGQFLLCSGSPGKRMSLPNTQIMMHQPLAGIRGSSTDMLIQADQFAAAKRRLAELTAHHTGQTFERIESDADRDRWFTADQALEYGMVDKIVGPNALWSALRTAT
jgi:ATP-dependent Clp protease protease subunit